MENTKTRDHQIFDLADKALKDLWWIAPEDTDMRRTKVINALLMASEPLNKIHRLLDGKEWDSETLDQIAGVLREAGFVVKEPE